MSLIRRSSSSGRRSVRSHLPESSKTDRAFLQALWFWLNVGVEAPSTWSATDLVRELEALGENSIEGLIPWLWGAWKIEPVKNRDANFRVPRMLVSDWWNGVKSAQPADTLPPKMKDVAGMAKGWHGMFEGPKTGKPLEKWAKDLLPQAFDVVVRWKGGTSWRVVKRPVRGRKLPQVRVFQEIGHVLAHCYLHYDVIQHYMHDHEMGVLFDENDDPRCAFAVRVREDDKGEYNWQITEQRGIFNIFPDRKYWPYLAALMDVKTSDYRSMPPGFDRIPRNQGTGEPPRARDARPDGEDPAALEVWAAGHLRRPLIDKIQKRLDELRPGVRESVREVEERRKTWRGTRGAPKKSPVVESYDDDFFWDETWSTLDYDASEVPPEAFIGLRSWLLAKILREQGAMVTWVVVDAKNHPLHAFSIWRNGGVDGFHPEEVSPEVIRREHGGARVRTATKREIDAYDDFEALDLYEAFDWADTKGLI